MSEDDDKVRLRYWQQIAIDQLGYSLNLTVTYTVAALGFWFALLKASDFTPSCPAKVFMVCALVALTVSVTCGFMCIINRLSDFRGTAKRARGDSDAPTKEHLQGFGKRSWILFHIHLWAFGLGVICIAVALILTYGHKLR